MKRLLLITAVLVLALCSMGTNQGFIHGVAVTISGGGGGEFGYHPGSPDLLPAYDTGGDELFVKFTSSVSGSVSYINVYIFCGYPNGPGRTVEAAIYADNAGAVGNKIASGAATQLIADNAWVAVAITGASVTASTVYWLGMQVQNGGDAPVYDTGTTNQLLDSAQSYGAWPNNPTGTYYDYTLALYATVQ